jgi:hypothetical protein
MSSLFVQILVLVAYRLVLGQQRSLNQFSDCGGTGTGVVCSRMVPAYPNLSAPVFNAGFHPQIGVSSFAPSNDLGFLEPLISGLAVVAVWRGLSRFVTVSISRIPCSAVSYEKSEPNPSISVPNRDKPCQTTPTAKSETRGRTRG